MIKIDIFSGFLGAGKTTLIKKLIKEAYNGEKLVLIENEFGDIGIDGEFMKDSGIQINELNSGCICCSLVGDFSEALKEVAEKFTPDRIIIEPSGVGKLSDVIKAVRDTHDERFVINGISAVVDAGKCRMYMKNFGEFFNDQIESAGCIVLSHTGNMSDDRIQAALTLIKEHNKDAVVISAPWEELNGGDILKAVEKKDSIEEELKKLEQAQECPVCGHHHEHECRGEHEHHHGHECHGNHEHHHGHCCHDGHVQHHGHCCHDDHESGHHHHHHADEVFTSCGFETAKKYTKASLKQILEKISNEKSYGLVLRAKGVVQNENGGWIHFDYVPGEADVRDGSPAVCGRICVIGSKIDEAAVKELFA